MKSNAFLHLHKRKRVHVKLEKYPHPNKLKRIMDRIIYFIAVLGPVTALPQIIKIWIEQTAAGVSVFFWVAGFIGAFFWMFYGYLHEEKPIIFANILWILIQGLIVLGILIYR